DRAAHEASAVAGARHGNLSQSHFGSQIPDAHSGIARVGDCGHALAIAAKVQGSCELPITRQLKQLWIAETVQVMPFPIASFWLAFIEQLRSQCDLFAAPVLADSVDQVVVAR